MTPFIGQILIFGGNYAPRGWAKCEGQLLNITDYTELYTVIGTIYGGDGRVSFALPDLRGRAPIHYETGPGLSTYSLGERGGAETITLAVSQIPSHNHAIGSTLEATMKVDAAIGTSSDPSDNYLANSGSFDTEYSPSITTAGTMASDAISLTGSINCGLTGGTQAHENRQPFIAMNYIIALQGTYPSRN